MRVAGSVKGNVYRRQLACFVGAMGLYYAPLVYTTLYLLYFPSEIEKKRHVSENPNIIVLISFAVIYFQRKGIRERKGRIGMYQVLI